jgi:hypothetical protein
MSGKTWEELWWVSYVALAAWIVNGFLIIYLQTQIDSLVNGQLYSYGLQFSKQWADPYWMSSRLMMVFLGVPMALSTAVLVTGFRRFRRKAKTLMTKNKPKPVQDRVECVEEKQPEVLKEPSPQAVPEVTARIEEQPEKTQAPPTEKQAEPQVTPNEPEVKPQVETQIEPQIEKEPEPIEEQKPIKEPEMGIIPQTNETQEPEPTIEKTEINILKEEPTVTLPKPSGTSCPHCGRDFNRPLVTLDFSTGTTRIVNVCPFCKHILGEGLDSKNEGKSQA